MRERSEDRRGKGAAVAWVVVTPLALLALYVLSVGPVILAVRRGWLDQRPGVGLAVMRFYRPLQWLHDRTPARRPLHEYTNMNTQSGGPTQAGGARVEPLGWAPSRS